MNIPNFIEAEFRDLSNCHDGEGVLKSSGLFGNQAFATNLSFINCTILPPGTTIGLHKHGNDEELYFFLEGSGTMMIDGVNRAVKRGDIVLNKPYGEHALYNDSQEEIKILVLGVKM